MRTYLWQNFLKDYKIKLYIFDEIKKIVEKNNIKTIIEIWPGKGAITKFISKLKTNIIAIEKDEKLIPILKDKFQDFKNVKIINEDILKYNLWNICNKNILIFGNIPYYITSPILRKFFWEKTCNNTTKIGFFLLQYDVWLKIQTETNKKSYLRRLLNYNNNIKISKTVPAKSFSPPPKVKSCLIKITNKTKPNVEYNQLLFFLENFAKYKRKTMWKIEKMQKDSFFKIPEEIRKKRLEELSRNDIENIINLSITK